MKTAQRILLVSLELFNTHGERNITSVDIANELDISPGNLYYHYKGKDEIVIALVDNYVDRIKAIRQTLEHPLDFFKYLYECLENMHIFRFLFQNVSELSSQYPAITSKIQRCAKFQREFIRKSLQTQQATNTLTGGDKDVDVLLDIISLTLFQSLNYYQMQGEELSDPDIVYRTLLTIYFSLQSYYTDEDLSLELQKSILQKEFS